MQCAVHPGTETYLRCGRCETPICPRCTVHTPVGARCRKCASHGTSPLFQASALQYTLAGLAAVGVGLLLGWLPRLLLLVLLGPVMYGYAVGEATLRAGGRRRGLGMQIVAGLAAFVGTLFWILGGPNGIARVLSTPSLFAGLLTNPFNLAALVLGTVCAVVHIRYI